MKNLLEISRPSKSDLPTIYCDMDQVLCNFLNGADKVVGGLFIHAQKTLDGKRLVQLKTSGQT